MHELKQVIRGGSWLNVRDVARADDRGGDRPDSRFDDGGFRVMRAPGDPGDARVMRGGSWRFSQHVARADSRGRADPFALRRFIGFRVMKAQGKSNV